MLPHLANKRNREPRLGIVSFPASCFKPMETACKFTKRVSRGRAYQTRTLDDSISSISNLPTPIFRFKAFWKGLAEIHKTLPILQIPKTEKENSTRRTYDTSGYVCVTRLLDEEVCHVQEHGALLESNHRARDANLPWLRF